jgi:hypothetical protein
MWWLLSTLGVEMKIKVKDREFEVSEAVGVSIVALQSDHGREIKALKDSVASKDAELKAVQDSNEELQAKYDKLNNSTLLALVVDKAFSVDATFKTELTDPYEIMREVAGVEDGKDNVYLRAYFDSYIDAKIEAENKRILDKQKNNDSTSIPDDYYNKKRGKQ